MSESTFTTSQTTAIGRVRGLVGDREKGSYLFTDEQVQSYLDTCPTETDAAIGLARATVAYYARRVVTLQEAPSPDNVKVAAAQAIVDNFRGIVKDLQESAASVVELPRVSFGRLGAHASEPRRWGYNARRS